MTDSSSVGIGAMNFSPSSSIDEQCKNIRLKAEVFSIVFVILSFAVHAIADNLMTYSTAVASYLMVASGFNGYFYQADKLIGFNGVYFSISV